MKNKIMILMLNAIHNREDAAGFKDNLFQCKFLDNVVMRIGNDSCW